MSHFSRLKEKLDSKQHELKEQQAAVESIEKLTRELEAQKQALVAKSADLINHRNEVRAMNERFEKLAALEPAINAAMHTKSGTDDVAKQVIEHGLRSDHLTSGDIVQTALIIAMQINGRSRRDNLDDLFDEIVTDDDSMKAAIESAMANSADVNEVVKYAVVTAIDGALDADTKNSIIKTVRAVLDEKAPVEPTKKAEAPLKENTPQPTVRLPRASRLDNNGLRGQAADFKPVPSSQPRYDGGGWQALARDNWENTGGSSWENTGGSSWENTGGSSW